MRAIVLRSLTGKTLLRLALAGSLLLAAAAVLNAWLLYRQILRSPRGEEWSRIYAPPQRADA